MSDTYRYPADLRRLAPEEIDRMRVAELRVCLSEALDEIRAADATVDRMDGHTRELEERNAALALARAQADARTETLAEALTHERRRLDNLAGLTGPADQLDGWELDEALDAIRNLLRAGR